MQVDLADRVVRMSATMEESRIAYLYTACETRATAIAGISQATIKDKGYHVKAYCLCLRDTINQDM